MCFPAATLQQDAAQIRSLRGEPGGLIGFIPSLVTATVQLRTATGTTDDLPWARPWNCVAHRLGAIRAKLVQQGASRHRTPGSANSRFSPAAIVVGFGSVLDVGHTAEEPGAMSARGIPEFTFNFRLAQYLRQQLIDAGFAQTEVLITAGASFSGLLQRVTRVNRMAPDLFLSIHHNSVPEALLETMGVRGGPAALQR